MTQNIVDPHLHLFALDLGDYGWLKPDKPPFWPDKKTIAKNVGEADLRLTEGLNLAGFVHIEAGFDNEHPWREIDWLESRCKLRFKSVACANLYSTDFAHTMQILAKRKSVVGIRHILDDEALAILSHPQCARNFAVLNEMNLSFDAQFPVHDTGAVHELIKHAKQNKNLRIIINHAGWPPVSGTIEDNKWQDNIHYLRDCENIAIKLSGWEMANRQWSFQAIEKPLKKVITCFGSPRVMLASNFPLCTLSRPYLELWQGYKNELHLSANLFQQLAYNNAAHWYKLN